MSVFLFFILLEDFISNILFDELRIIYPSNKRMVCRIYGKCFIRMQLEKKQKSRHQDILVSNIINAQIRACARFSEEFVPS